MCAHTACFCSTEHSSSFRVLLKHRGHPVTQGHRRISGTGPPGNRKWRLSEQWTPGLTGGSQHPLWGPTSQALGTQDQADTEWDEQTRNYCSAAMPSSQLRDSQPVISRQRGTPTPLHTIDSSADSRGAGQAGVGWAPPAPRSRADAGAAGRTERFHCCSLSPHPTCRGGTQGPLPLISQSNTET